MSYDNKVLAKDLRLNPVPQYFNPATDQYEVVQGASGAVNNLNVGAKTVAFDFHNAATATANGGRISVSGLKALTIEVYGTSASRTVKFVGFGPGGTARPISGVRLSDFAIATETTGTGEFWQFDITGLTGVEMQLTAVAGGNVSVKGTAVA